MTEQFPPRRGVVGSLLQVDGSFSSFLTLWGKIMKQCHPLCTWSCCQVCFDGLDVSADTGRCTARLTLNSAVIPNDWSLQRFKPFELSSGFLALIPVPCAVMQVVELISGGAQIAVTNENKMHYLNLLAQYRLATQVRDEVEHFLKGKDSLSHWVALPGNSSVHALNQTPWTIAGLNELVPENLLAIFDENELEVCVMFIMKVCCRLKRHLGIPWVFFFPFLTSSAVDVRYWRYKCAGL